MRLPNNDTLIKIFIGISAVAIIYFIYSRTKDTYDDYEYDYEYDYEVDDGEAQEEYEYEYDEAALE